MAGAYQSGRIWLVPDDAALPEQRLPGRVPSPDSVRARRAAERVARRDERLAAKAAARLRIEALMAGFGDDPGQWTPRQSAIGALYGDGFEKQHDGSWRHIHGARHEQAWPDWSEVDEAFYAFCVKRWKSSML